MIETGCVCFSDESTPIPACLFLGNATVDKLEDFINNINSVLESLYIEIKKGVTEDDGRPIYALVNLATTSVSKMATDFAETKLNLFKKGVGTDCLLRIWLCFFDKHFEPR